MAARIIAPPSIALPETPSVAAAPSPGTRARIWLVRHAEVHVDWQKKAYGDTDVPLSPEGELDTARMAQAFAGRPLARVTSSDLARAHAMGRAVADSTRAPLVLDARLREIHRGQWQGLASDEFRARWERDAANFLAAPWHWKGHGGESDAELCARVWPALIEAVEATPGRELALAAHYNVMRVLVTRALGLSTRQSFEFRNDPAHATLLVDEPGGFRLLGRDLPRPEVP